MANDPDIVIKEADKGGAVVIMDCSHYIKMIEYQLNDTQYYEYLDTDPNHKDKLNYRKLIDRFQTCFTHKEYDYLTNFEVKQRNFYGLPKIHKSKQINEKCSIQQSSTIINISNVTDLKVRPIVAGPSCQTHRLSNLLDILLRPLTKFVRSNIKDSTDFLNSLPGTVEKDIILTSFDVESLYSNISHELGLKSIEFWVENHLDVIHTRFTKNFIISATEFILKNNTFFFNDKFFRQIKGTAMGTKFAPVYATLVLGYVEEELLYPKIAEIYNTEFKIYIINYWKRFLDDVFILWPKSKHELNCFNILLNNLHKDLKFTMENNIEKLPFLDVLVKLKGDQIETDIYYKPTDSKQYLLFNSCHPKHTKQNIPFSLARRLCTIISNRDVLHLRLNELNKFLASLKYPQKLIENGIQRALAIEQSELRKTKLKTDEKVIPYVSTHNPRNTEFFTVIQENLPILQNDEIMKGIIDRSHIIKSKRQPANLKKLLTRARFSSTLRKNKIKRCSSLKCGLCKHMIEGNTYHFKNGREFKVKFSGSCDIRNVIYALKCNGCSKDYIGETSNLRNRVTLHNQHIRNPDNALLPVSRHIAICAKDITPKFNIMPIYKMREPDTFKRRMKETVLINVLKPELNSK